MMTMMMTSYKKTCLFTFIESMMMLIDNKIVIEFNSYIGYDFVSNIQFHH